MSEFIDIPSWYFCSYSSSGEERKNDKLFLPERTSTGRRILYSKFKAVNPVTGPLSHINIPPEDQLFSPSALSISNRNQDYNNPAKSEFYFLEADLRQAEAMVVAWLANETRLIKIFTSAGDVHKRNAAMIFGIPEDQIDSQKRYLGKKVAHGANYGLGAKRLVEIIQEETDGKLVISTKYAQTLIDSYHEAYPNIRPNYHQWVEEQLNKSMTLYTPPPFNRRRIFHGRRYDQSTYGEGYANVPQSTVVDVTSTALKTLLADGWDVRLHIHDALLNHVHVSQLWHAYVATRSAMSIPLHLYPFCQKAYQQPLTIPVDFEIGQRLGTLTGLKNKPDEEIKLYFESLIPEYALE